MSHFLGEFECKLDAKGRMMIPGGLKRQLPEAEREGLVINRGFEKHLVIYNPQRVEYYYRRPGNVKPIRKTHPRIYQVFYTRRNRIIFRCIGQDIITKSVARICRYR